MWLDRLFEFQFLIESETCDETVCLCHHFTSWIKASVKFIAIVILLQLLFEHSTLFHSRL